MSPEKVEQKIRVLRKRNRILACRYEYRHVRELRRMKAVRQRELYWKHSPFKGGKECAIAE